MKDLLSKQHYSYTVYTLLMKSSAYPLLLTTPPIWITFPHFYKKILSLPPLWLFKNLSSSYKKMERWFTMRELISKVGLIRVLCTTSSSVDGYKFESSALKAF